MEVGRLGGSGMLSIRGRRSVRKKTETETGMATQWGGKRFLNKCGENGRETVF